MGISLAVSYWFAVRTWGLSVNYGYKSIIYSAPTLHFGLSVNWGFFLLVYCVKFHWAFGSTAGSTYAAGTVPGTETGNPVSTYHWNYAKPIPACACSDWPAGDAIVNILGRLLGMILELLKITLEPLVVVVLLGMMGIMLMKLLMEIMLVKLLLPLIRLLQLLALGNEVGSTYASSLNDPGNSVGQFCF